MRSRSRAWVILSVLSLAACTTESREPDLPASISPGWHRSGLTHAGKDWTATYTGPGTATVQATAITGSAEGLDRVQKWRARADAVVFYSDHYFAVISWAGADRAHVAPLIHSLERAIR